MKEIREYLPEWIYDAVQVGALDRRFIDEFGVDGFDLMQRAARAAFDALLRLRPEPGRLCTFCGPGNNGGDGFLVAALALQAGWQVQLISLVDPDRLNGNAARAADAFRAAGGEIERFAGAPVAADAVVDALLGTGLNRDVEGRFADAIACINTAGEGGASVLSVDIASGIDAGTGRVWAHAVRADTTATFIGVKLGLLTGAGPDRCGEIVFSTLDAPDTLYGGQPAIAQRLGQRLLRHTLGARSRGAHKGDSGRVLCVGGNRGMGGAIRMTAEAALRGGAGLVSVACHPDHAGAMSQARPELMCRGLAAGDAITSLIEAADVIAIGPGLGGDEWGDGLWQTVMDSSKPLVMDADALNRLACAPRTRGNWILTPHPGEAARLLDWPIADVINDRVAAVRELAHRYDAVAVLKGAGSLVAAGERLWVCSDGNPGMAVGGMGDLLTGVIAALRGQGLDAATAAGLGVYVHAIAGDAAARHGGERGLLPSDLLKEIRRGVNPTVT